MDRKNLKVGDAVKIIRAAKSMEGGWTNSWELEMNDAVGKIGTVTRIDKRPAHDVTLAVPGIKVNLGYPDFVLQPALGGFAIGDTVRAPNRGGFDNPCTVVSTKGDFVYITQNANKSCVGGFYPRNLRHISSPDRSTIKPHLKIFEIAKNVAVALAKQNPQRIANADLVQKELIRSGYTSTDLGNAAGHIFRSKLWKKVGSTKSARKGNHLREISNWEYVGQ